MIQMSAILNLGRDAEVKEIGGQKVINFSGAHTEKRKEGDPITIWVDCAYWTDKTGILPYLTKGTQVYVDGQPSVRTYVNNAGEPKVSLTLRVRGIQLLGGVEKLIQAAKSELNPVVPQDSDLPF